MTPQRFWPNLPDLDPDDPALDWQPFGEGIEIVPIHGQVGSGSACALLRYAPGAQLQRHAHVGHEHLLILRGSQSDEHGHYPRGSFIVNAPGSRHSVRSDEGCVVLAIWESPVRFDPPQTS
jgi:anti-sigma factor ChrR (cupin superfamily)